MTAAFRRRFGVQALFVVLTFAVVAIIAAIGFVFSYRGMAYRDFGTRARIAAITELYKSIEKTPATDFIAVEYPKEFGFPETRVIPASAIPEELVGGLWGKTSHSGGAVIAGYGDVLAHYDGQHQLRAIEFYGSRYGCFVSRDAALQPEMRGELHQLAGAPIYITARITGGD